MATLLVAVLVSMAAYFYVDGLFVRQMIAHIALMGPLACLFAMILLKLYRYELPVSFSNSNFCSLWLATVIQLLFFLAFHIPFIHQKMHFHGAYMLVPMLAASIWFWTTVFHTCHKNYWKSVLALLLTGKAFCLIAVLLIFSPRSLYSNSHYIVGLGEQQLAGLIMVVACPLTYICAAVLLSVRWLDSIAHMSPFRIVEPEER